MSADRLILAIGSLNDDDVAVDNSNAGHLHVYRWNDEDWTQMGSDVDGEYVGDQSGISVSLQYQVMI